MSKYKRNAPRAPRVSKIKDLRDLHWYLFCWNAGYFLITFIPVVLFIQIYQAISTIEDNEDDWLDNEWEH